MKKLLLLLVFLLSLSNSFSSISINLIQPSNNSQNVSRPVQLAWSIVNDEQKTFNSNLQISIDSNFVLLLCSVTIKECEYKVYGLDNNSDYYWRILAINTQNPNEQNTSPIYHFTTEATTNSSPNLISPRNYEERIPVNAGQFNWSAVAQANFYNIQISQNVFFFNEAINLISTTNSCTNTVELEPMLEYYWRVRAGFINGPDTSFADWSIPFRFTTKSTIDAPDIYSPEDKIEYSSNEFYHRFSWSFTEGINDIFEISTDSLMRNSIKSTLNFYEDEYRINQYMQPGRYYWRVQTTKVDNPNAQNPKLIFSDWTPIRSFTVKQEPKNYLEIDYPQNSSTDVPLDTFIRWTTISNVEYYEFELYHDNNSTGVIQLTAPYYHVSDLHTDELYLWHVRAKYTSNNEEKYTAWCGMNNFTTVDTITILPIVELKSPEIPIIKTGKPETTTFIWSSVLRANCYQLQIAWDEGFQSIILDTITTETYLINSKLFNDKDKIFWRVRGINKIGESIKKTGIWSEIRNITYEIVFPHSPNLIAPANMSENMPQIVTLQWELMPNAAYYVVYTYGSRTGSKSMQTVSNSVSFDAQTFYNSVSWYVYAFTNDGWCSGADSTYYFNTGIISKVCPPLYPPDSTVFKDYDIHFQWTEQTNAVYYRFQLSDYPAFIPYSNGLLSEIANENSTIVIDTILKTNSLDLTLKGINKPYYWRVYAKYSAIDSTTWSAPWSIIVDNVNGVMDSTLIDLDLTYSISNNTLKIIQLKQIFDYADIYIYDSNGELVRSIDTQSFLSNLVEIDISRLISGNYRIIISNKKLKRYMGICIIR